VFARFAKNCAGITTIIASAPIVGGKGEATTRIAPAPNVGNAEENTIITVFAQSATRWVRKLQSAFLLTRTSEAGTVLDRRIEVRLRNMYLASLHRMNTL